jgi:hypothetical protein
MKRTDYKTHFTKRFSAFMLVVVFTGSTLVACNKDVLKETPLAFMNVESTLTNKAGFESALTALHIAVRDLYFNPDGPRMHSMQLGTDVAINGDPSVADFVNYTTWLTPAATTQTVNENWDWAYTKVIPRANTIIEYANKPNVTWAGDAEKNAVIAEARFFRAFAYNWLAKLYGGVPIVDKVYTEDKRDFVRATRQEVWDFARQDLEFASQWLPVTAPLKGRIAKGAADHLLAEVYISLNQYDKAIESANKVINGPYKLMISRFGNFTSQPGDVYSDLFKDNNQNLDANKETIWAIQMEYQTAGGVPPIASGGNTTLRAWGNRYWNLKDPDGKAGMVVADSLGRGVGWVRATNYFFYDVWNEDPSDMRNSRNNIRRDFYFNNPASRFVGQKVDPNNPKADTTWDYYPTIRKIEGLSLAGATYGRTFKDHYIMRLAETYLLRAEAYLRKGDLQKAADDINVVRSRASAKPVTADRVTIDYILDERARELIIEEPRRLTLSRMGKLVERVKKYNPRSASGILPRHELYPIPQKVIDVNSGAEIKQNPDY